MKMALAFRGTRSRGSGPELRQSRQEIRSSPTQKFYEYNFSFTREEMQGTNDSGIDAQGSLDAVALLKQSK
jgi:hypothetical protein